MNEIQKELDGKGFWVLAVNPGYDTKDVIKNYWKEGGFTFGTIISDGPADACSKYGVKAFPTNYLVGKDGKILWRGVGFDEDGLRAALKDAGVLTR